MIDACKFDNDGNPLATCHKLATARVEVERWQNKYMTLLDEIERLKYIEREFHNIDDVAEIERLRPDAERYRWLKARNELALCGVAYGVLAACEFDTADEAIDAAMKP